jgi:hypothetical protein
MNSEIDRTVGEAWKEWYDWVQAKGLILIDLGITCSQMRGVRWHAKVNRGGGASGHGKGFTPDMAVVAAITDCERSRQAWERGRKAWLEKMGRFPMAETEQQPLDLGPVELAKPPEGAYPRADELEPGAQ